MMSDAKYMTFKIKKTDFKPKTSGFKVLLVKSHEVKLFFLKVKTENYFK